MDLKRTRSAVVIATVGLLTTCAGLSWIYPPAGIVVLGVAVVLVGLFGIEVDK